MKDTEIEAWKNQEPKLKTFFESYITSCSFPGEGGFDVGEDRRGSLGGNLLLVVYSS